MIFSNRFKVKYIIVSFGCFIGFCSPSFSQDKSTHFQHSAAEKQQISLAKKLKIDLFNGNYKKVYSQFGANITSKMSRSVFMSRVIPVFKDTQRKAAALTEKNQHIYLNSRTVRSFGTEQPNSGKYTTVCFVTSYERTPVKNQLCFSWLNNNLKVAGFNFRLSGPR